MITKTKVDKIPLGRPIFDKEEAAALQEVLSSPWILNGPKVRSFEEAFCATVGSKHAASVSSCTAGMHLSVCAYDFHPNDEVLLPAFNFTADGLAVLQAGLKPVFVDVNPKTGNMDVENLTRRVGKRSRAILVLHYAGRPSNMSAILEIAKKHRLKVIEDASHALGAAYGAKKIGAIGDATVFSFGPLKMLCTGMGGMVTSDDDAFIQKIASLRSYGMDKSSWNRKEKQRPWSYSIDKLGHNFRMTDLQGALGIVQLSKLDRFIDQRDRLMHRYDEQLKACEQIEFFETEKNAQMVCLYYAVKLKEAKDRDPLAMHLIKQDIGASVHWDPPLHLHPLYRDLGYKDGDYPETEKLAKRILSLPLSPAMTVADVDRIAGEVIKFLKS